MITVYIQYRDLSEPGQPLHMVKFETDAFRENTDEILEQAKYHFHFDDNVNYWIA